MDYINAREVSVSYFDVCPSEYFFSISTNYITHAGVHYFMIFKPGLITIPQYKRARGYENKIKWINYLKENIENRKIGFYCRAINIRKRIGINNGLNFLVKEGIISPFQQFRMEDKINYRDYEITIKNMVSLCAYAISMILISPQLAVVSKVENKKQFAFLLDLLPTDSLLSFKNLHILKYLIFNSPLFQYLNEDLQKNHLERVGIGYGQDNGSTNEIKKWHEYSITDWILHCINHKANIISEGKNPDTFTEFTDFLISQDLLEITECPLLMI